jgi:hypothetical protein
MEANGQHHALAALPPEKTPNTQTLGRPHSQTGRYEDKKNVLLPMGFETLMIQPQVLLIFERKIFRRIYGPKYEDGEWKSRTNRELEELSKGENIVKWIKGQRISWLGHLERMEEDKKKKKSSLKKWKGQDKEEDPGKDGEKK